VVFYFGSIIGRGYGPIDLLRPIKKIHISKPEVMHMNSSKQNQKVLAPSQLTFYQKIKQNTAEKLITLKKHREKTLLEHSFNDVQQEKDKYYFLIQICAFSRRKEAISRALFLKRKGFRTKIEKVEINSKIWFRLYVVLEGDMDFINRKKRKLQQLEFKDFFVKKKLKI